MNNTVLKQGDDFIEMAVKGGRHFKIDHSEPRWKILPITRHYYVVAREDYRKLMHLRRKKMTYKQIGEIYPVSNNRIMQILRKFYRMRKHIVEDYLEYRQARSEAQK